MIRWVTLFLWIATLLTLGGEGHSFPPAEFPAAPLEVATAAVPETEALTVVEPPDELETYLSDFHFTNGYPEDQVETHLYCSPLSPDLTQCVVFDGNGPGARVIGVEYVISGRLFGALPPEEKRLWHSHGYEVKSGQLAAPGFAAEAERELLRDYAATYGKMIRTWHPERDPQLPLDAPVFMMSFTAPGQIHPHLLEERDQRLGISTTAQRHERRNLPVPRADSEADAWQQGDVWQMILVRQGETVPAVPAGR